MKRLPISLLLFTTLAALHGGSAMSWGAECERDADRELKSRKGTLYAAKYESRSEEPNEDKYKYMYCVENTNNDIPIKFEWRKAKKDSYYFNDTVPPQIKKGQHEESSDSDDTGKRTMIYNYGHNESRETVFQKHENPSPQAAINERSLTLHAYADFHIPRSTDITYEIRKQIYKYARKDFTIVAVRIRSVLNRASVTYEITNILEVRSPTYFSRIERQNLKEYPVFVRGPLNVFGSDVEDVRRIEPNGEGLRLENTTSVRSVTEQAGDIQIIDTDGQVLAAMSFKFFARN